MEAVNTHKPCPRQLHLKPAQGAAGPLVTLSLHERTEPVTPWGEREDEAVSVRAQAPIYFFPFPGKAHDFSETQLTASDGSSCFPDALASPASPSA